MIAEAGKGNLPVAKESGENKISARFCVFRSPVLCVAGGGGGKKKSDANLKVPGSAKHYSDLGGENCRKKIQLRL